MGKSKENKSWGGRREGAGRPGTNSRLYTFRAPESMAEYIDSHENKTEFIKECIERAIERRPKFFGSSFLVSRVKDMSLPYFDIGVVAGFPVPLDNDEKSQDIDLLRMLCPHPESSYLIRVEGYSMIDAGIETGDIVIVDKSNRNPGPAQVAVCEYNGEYTLKHFVREDGCGWLVPDNPDFPRIKIEPGDSFSIWGTVTYIIHKPR